MRSCEGGRSRPVPVDQDTESPQRGSPVPPRALSVIQSRSAPLLVCFFASPHPGADMVPSKGDVAQHSSRRSLERLGTPGECGDRRRASEAPVIDRVGVEPHKPQQPIGAGTSEKVRDLRWLTCGRRRAGRGDEYWVEGQCAHGLDGGPEQGSERPGRLEVIAVDPHPGHIRTAGPPGGRRGNAGWLTDDVDRPQPGHVVGALLPEYVDDVPPGGHKHRWGCVPVCPGVPIPIHLVPEADDDALASLCAVAGHGGGKSLQIGVELAGGDRREVDARRFYLDKRYATLVLYLD